MTLTTNVTQDFALDFLQPYTRNGTGDAAFDLLTLDRQQVRIQGRYTGNSSPFVVSIDNETLVDERLGASHNNTTFEGTFTIGAGTAAIENSPGVAWSFTEIR